MLHNLVDSCLVSVTPENVDKYLPGISDKLRGVRAHHRGRLDKLHRIFKGDPRNLAVKCDIIRAQLIKKYGGIYIDSDAIVLRDFNQYFEILAEREFLIMRRESHNKSHVSIGLYGAQEQTEIISRYAEQQLRSISTRKIFDFTELGEVMLTPIIEPLESKVHFIPESEIQPITHEDSHEKMLSAEIEPEDVLNGNEAVFMLFHGIFKNALKSQSIEQLYYGNNLVSKVFRRALPEEVFKSFMLGA